MEAYWTTQSVLQPLSKKTSIQTLENNDRNRKRRMFEKDTELNCTVAKSSKETQKINEKKRLKLEINEICELLGLPTQYPDIEKKSIEDTSRDIVTNERKRKALYTDYQMRAEIEETCRLLGINERDMSESTQYQMNNQKKMKMECKHMRRYRFHIVRTNENHQESRCYHCKKICYNPALWEAYLKRMRDMEVLQDERHSFMREMKAAKKMEDIMENQMEEMGQIVESKKRVGNQ
ncbi:hypothetical protein WDU94_008139 [Cyamophila willieti]